jgi:ankyrin repeat protein/WD40 repeat protein
MFTPAIQHRYIKLPALVLLFLSALFIFSGNSQSQQLELVLQSRHIKYVKDVSISPDGNWLLTLDESNLKIWDLSRRRLFATLNDFDDHPLEEVCWHANSDQFFILEGYGPGGRYIRSLNRSTLKTNWYKLAVASEDEYMISTYNAWDIEYHQESDLLSVLIYDGAAQLYLYDAESGEEVGHSPEVKEEYFYGKVWHPSKRLFYTTGSDGRLRSWQPGEDKYKELHKQGEVISNLCIRGDTLAFLANDGKVFYVNSNTGKRMKTRPIITYDLDDYFFKIDHPMVWLPDGSIIITNKQDGDIPYALYRHRDQNIQLLHKAFRADAMDYHAGRDLLIAADGNKLFIYNMGYQQSVTFDVAQFKQFDQIAWQEKTQTLYASGANSSYVHSFNLSNGQFDVHDTGYWIERIHYSPEQSEWVIVNNGQITFYDEDFNLTDSIHVHRDGVVTAGMGLCGVSADGQYLITHSGTRHKCGITYWSRSPLKPIYSFPVDNEKQYLWSMDLSASGRYCWVVTSNNYFSNYHSFVYDLEKRENIFQAEGEYKFRFWPNKDVLLINDEVYDLEKRTFISESTAWPPISATKDYDVYYSDGKLGLVNITDRTYEVIDSLNEHKEIISLGVDKVASISEGQILVYDVKPSAPLTTLIAESFDEVPLSPFYIMLSPDNKFMTLRSPERLAQFRINNTLVPFELLSSSLNQPDKVLRQLGFASENTIDLYAQARKKSTQLASSFNIQADDLLSDKAQLSLLNRKDVPLLTRQEAAVLDCKYIIPSKEKLDSLFIRYAVNGVPAPDVSIPITQNHEGKLQISVPLSLGTNRIEIYLYKGNSLLLAGDNITIDRIRVANANGKLLVVGLGVAKYQQSSYNLEYPAKDVTDFARFFQRVSGERIVETLLLTDSLFTKKQLNDIRSFLKNARAADRLLFLYSGHGVLTDDKDLYLASWDMDFANPAQKGISIYELEQLLKECPAREKALFIDACHSGWLDEEALATNYTNYGKGVKGDPVPSGDDSPKIALNVESSFDVMTRLFSFTNRDNGASLLTAASGAEFAVEIDTFKNGLFTYTLLEGLRSAQADFNKDEKIQFSELEKYVDDRVTARSGGQQKPTSRYTNPYADFVISSFKTADFGILHEAANAGDNAKISQLLSTGAATVDVLGKGGFTALHYAARQGHISTVQLLIDKGADINKQSNLGWTPLHLATHNNHLYCVKTLLNAGARNDIYDSSNNIPYMTALNNCNINMAITVGLPESLPRESKVYYLLLLDINCGDNQLLDQVIKDAEFDLDYIDDPESISLLSASVITGKDTTCQKLLAAGADPNLLSTKDNWSPIYFAVSDNNIVLTEMLIQAGASMKTLKINNAKWPLLNIAARGNQLEMTQLLLKYGADPNEQDFFGETALYIAVENEQVQLVKVLVKAGADPTIRTGMGLTAYIKAKEKGGKVWKLIK